MMPPKSALLDNAEKERVRTASIKAQPKARTSIDHRDTAVKLTENWVSCECVLRSFLKIDWRRIGKGNSIL
jgi:hypothetical protein